MQRNAELEAAVVASPEDDVGYLVYGDWLQQRGEPIGQLVAIQHALAATPDDPDRLAAESALLCGTPALFFGPPHPFADTPGPERLTGNQNGRWRAQAGDWSFGHAMTRWRNGFIDQLWFDTGYYCDDDDTQDGSAAAAILSAMLAAPAARFVREIHLGDQWIDDDEGPNLGHALRAIAAAPCADVVRAIRCVGGDHDISGVSCEAGDLWGACPRLEHLQLYGNNIDIGRIVAPRLRNLVIRSGGLGGDVVRAIGEATLPALESLEVWFGREHYGASSSIGDLTGILDGARLPALTRLALDNCEFGDELCGVLPTAPILPRLKALDVTMGIVTDQGARVLLANASAFSGLTLSVAGYFSDEVSADLKAMGARVYPRGRPDERYKYAEVGE